jgi:glycosyltransferase involved in cell wall biosynthesis
MNILFVHGNLLSFTKLDMEILRSRHHVVEVHFRRNSLSAMFGSISATAKAIPRADLVFCWFGSYHALVPFLFGKLFNRPCVVVAGGYDVDAVPEIGYGNMRPGVRRLIGLAVFRLADLVLPFSTSAERYAAENARVPQRKMHTIPLGVDVDGCSRDSRDVRTGVITVCQLKESNIKRKGLDTIIKAARLLPDIPFTIVGRIYDRSAEILRASASGNVRFTGFVTDEELQKLLRTASVYLQISAHEGFGMALAEAMSRGCVPVVTARGSIPEVVGEVGRYVPFGDPEATASAIRQVYESEWRTRVSVVDHIRCAVPLWKRRDELLRVVEMVCDQSRAAEGVPKLSRGKYS